MLKKCICINNTHEYSASHNIHLLKYGMIYDYEVLSSNSNYICISGSNQLFTVRKNKDFDNKSITYFNEFFIDMEEYRKKQINIILEVERKHDPNAKLWDHLPDVKFGNRLIKKEDIQNMLK